MCTFPRLCSFVSLLIQLRKILCLRITQKADGPVPVSNWRSPKRCCHFAALGTVCGGAKFPTVSACVRARVLAV